jgi:uncharacterized peroxidase-related enzyme
MARDKERKLRAQEDPIVGSLADVPGIGVAMRLSPQIGLHLRGLADQALVEPYSGATITRAEREMLATAVSAANDCFFCMDSHAAHATAVMEREGGLDQVALLDTIKTGSSEGFSPKMQALLHIARTVRRDARSLTRADTEAASAAGASDADVQLAVLISAAFSMYNRLVDGFRARTPTNLDMYRARAGEIAENGYSGPSQMAPPQPVGAKPGAG